MSHTLERTLADSVILVTWESGFDFDSDAEACAQHILSELEAASYPVFLIIDMRLHHISLDTMLAVANMEIGGLLLRHHPHLKQMILVYESGIKQLQVTPPDDKTPALPPLRLFPTRDESLANVKTSIF